MLNRRLFLASAALVLTAALPGISSAQEADGLKNLLSGIAGAASRSYIEKHRDDAEWDGKYYYDRYDRKRYSRDEWLKELERRDREERAGRDWRDDKRRAWEDKRYGKNYRDFSKRRDEAIRREDEHRARAERERAERERRRER